MGYTPYKMVGHTLPGIKQRKPAVAKMKAFGTKTLEGPKKQDLNPGSGLNYGNSGVGSSPAKGWLKNMAKKIGGGAKKLMGKTLVGKALGIGGKGEGGGGGKIKDKFGQIEGRISALEEGASAGGAEETQDGVGGATGGGTVMDAMQESKFKTMGLPHDFGGMIAKMKAAKAKKKERMGMWGGIDGAGGDAVAMMSDVRLKEKIEKAGKSPSGIPIYEFNYIGGTNRYSGAMAQDLISMGIDAVEMQGSGYYSVDYSKIDVDMKLIN